METQYFDYTNDGNSGFVKNPVPVLQQPVSKMTSNTWLNRTQPSTTIKSGQQLNNFGKGATAPSNVNQAVIQPALQTSPSFTEINKNLSITVIDIMNELLNKPDDIPWKNYINMTVDKDDRYIYISILLIMIVLIIILVY